MAQRRYLFLIGLFALSAWALAGMAPARSPDAARWPTDDSVFAVEGWTVGPITIETANGVTFVSRTYDRNSTSLTLTISTSPEVKRIYRAGPEVPFLGAGFTLDSRVDQLVPIATGRGAILARQGKDAWLAIHAYGERRGLLGNGPVGWGAAIVDGILDRPNDYFLARVVTRFGGDNPNVAVDAMTITDEVFPRLAGWYAVRDQNG
jgi:hypothetical protein